MRSKIMFLLFTLMLSNLSFATNPYCNDFNQIQRMSRSLDADDVECLLDDPQWEDETYRRRSEMQLAGQAGKVLITFIIRRASVIGNWAVPTRAEAATVTGSYIRNPESFNRFLQLSPARACQVLGIPGREGDTLRSMTRELRIELARTLRR